MSHDEAHVKVRPDKLKDYFELAKDEIIPGIKKSEPKDYSIAQGRFGEPNTVITSVAGFNNWADLDDELDSDPEMLKSISNGWPIVLSGLKTLLETGKPLSLKK